MVVSLHYPTLGEVSDQLKLSVDAPIMVKERYHAVIVKRCRYALPIGGILPPGVEPYGFHGITCKQSR